MRRELRDDAELREARQILRGYQEEVGEGVPAVARRIGLDRGLEGVERKARGPIAVGMNVDVEALAVGAPDDVGEQVGRQQRVAARLGRVGVRGEERPGPLRVAAVDVQLQHRSLHQLGVEFPLQRLDHRDGIDVGLLW